MKSADDRASDCYDAEHDQQNQAGPVYCEVRTARRCVVVQRLRHQPPSGSGHPLGARFFCSAFPTFACQSPSSFSVSRTGPGSGAARFGGSCLARGCFFFAMTGIVTLEGVQGVDFCSCVGTPGGRGIREEQRTGFAMPYLANGEPHDDVPDFLNRLRADGRRRDRWYWRCPRGAGRSGPCHGRGVGCCCCRWSGSIAITGLGEGIGS